MISQNQVFFFFFLLSFGTGIQSLRHESWAQETKPLGVIGFTIQQTKKKIATIGIPGACIGLCHAVTAVAG